MATPEEIADQLIKIDLPVIFLDTCIFLDIIRAIKRRQSNGVRDAVKLLAAAGDHPRRCVVIASHVVTHEWNANQEGLRNEALEHFIDIEDQADHFHVVCEVLGIPPGFSRANFAGVGVADRLHKLSEDLLGRAMVIDPDNDCSGRAMMRLIHNLPPSKKGREAKDCIILEQYLAVCRRLLKTNFPRKRVFCTSNTNDYCDATRGLHTNLATEFASAGLEFASNLSMGFHRLFH